MTAVYIYTEAEHSLIVAALTPFSTPNWAGDGVDAVNTAIAALKAKQPVEPFTFGVVSKDGAKSFVVRPLYLAPGKETP